VQFSPKQSATLNEILRWRRDVRHFQQEKIPEPVMQRLQQSMELAPSVGNSRPWRVIRLQNAALRAQVCEIFDRCNLAAAANYDEPEKGEYLTLKLAGLAEAPEHLVVFTETTPTAGRGLGRQTMPEMLAYSTALAIHTLWLAARAENIGLGWVSILDPTAVTALLAVPPSWLFTGYLCLGYPLSGESQPLLEQVGWQANMTTPWREM
jgi:5,6-dimethylbenzimidazole synthase